MNRAKVCRPGNRRWIHDGVIVNGTTVPVCQSTSTDRWHRLPNNMTTNCQPCIRLRIDGRFVIHTGRRRRYFDSIIDARRIADAVFRMTGVIVAIERAQ